MSGSTFVGKKLFLVSMQVALFFQLLASCNRNPSSNQLPRRASTKGQEEYVSSKNCKSGRAASLQIVGETEPLQNDIRKTSAVLIRARFAKSKSGSLCTGVVIAPRLILTASHCFFNQAEKGIVESVFFGDVLDEKQVVVDPAESLMLNPNYKDVQNELALAKENLKNIFNDIALIKLKSDVPAGTEIAKLSHESVSTGTQVWLVGFGLQNIVSNSGVGTKKMASALTIVSKIQQDLAAAGEDPQKLMVVQNSRETACHGDSGGPLFVKSGSTFLLAAIMSGGVAKDGKQECSVGDNNLAVQTFALVDWVKMTSGIDPDALPKSDLANDAKSSPGSQDSPQNCL